MNLLKQFINIIILTLLVLSCTNKDNVNTIQKVSLSLDKNENSQRYNDIGLRLHTMIQWTDDSNSLWKRVYFGNQNDIIIETEDKTIINDSERYQYILFDYIQQKVSDIITVNDSLSPLLFYKSRSRNILLMESFDGSQRYKYVYNDNISTFLTDNEFNSLFNGSYISESPKSDDYLAHYVLYESKLTPYKSYYIRDKSHLPKAWPENLIADYKLLDNLTARVFNSGPSGYITRPTDWKILNNKYIFMLNSNENSNPYGHRAYYVVRTLSNGLVFTIPQIVAPYKKSEGDPLKALHDTLIDFNFDQSKVLIKGMHNNKLCIMIYDIINYDEWKKTNVFTASSLILNNDIKSPLQTNSKIDGINYSVEPGTTSLYGVFGNVIGENYNLYKEPNENSNIIMQMDYFTIDKFKHDDKDGVFPWEMLCFEILDFKKIINNEAEEFWFHILFDSAINYNILKGSVNNFNPDIYNEYNGWISSRNIDIIDKIYPDTNIISRALPDNSIVTYHSLFSNKNNITLEKEYWNISDGGLTRYFFNAIKITTEKAEFNALYAAEENIQVYNIPDIITGTVVYTLKLDEDVYVIEISTSPITINGKNGIWSKISSPVDGWIFAAQLKH